MITVKQFLDMFPSEYPKDSNPRIYVMGLGKPIRYHERDILQGFIHWDNDEACCWGGPWEGNHVFFHISDFTNAIHPWGNKPLETAEELLEVARKHCKYSPYNYPQKLVPHFNPLSDNERNQILDALSEKQISKLDQKINDEINRYSKELLESVPHVEKPIRFYMCGNDDTSYTAVFATEKEALLALKMIEEVPLLEIMHEYNFTYTN